MAKRVKQGPHGPIMGRPPTIEEDPEIIDRLAKLIEEVGDPRTACDLLPFPWSSYRRLWHKGEEFAAMDPEEWGALTEPEKRRAGVYVRLWALCTPARARRVQAASGVVANGMEGKPLPGAKEPPTMEQIKAAQYWLDRQGGPGWSPKQQIGGIDVEDGGRPVDVVTRVAVGLPLPK